MGVFIKMDETKNNELVRYSRAGDAFHYRWAARRCLKMIYPSSAVESIVIEGTRDKTKAGEYVIDVTEYLSNGDKQSQIKYYQLKHTTVQKNETFKLSDLKETLAGFSAKYKEHSTGKKNNGYNIHFYLVTNRPVDANLKKNILKLANLQKYDSRFYNTIKKYTGLEEKQLSDFCKFFIIIDDEGDYIEQRLELQVELSQLLVGSIDHPQIDTITNLIANKALPDSDGVIYPEDVLKRFGCSSARDLYPAPPEYETDNNIILTEQHQKLTKIITTSRAPVVIHAAGGVGKSIFANAVSCYLTDDSMAVIYDCFGAGKYRNRSQPRHRHRDGLVQIINELAIKGLCDPIIAQSTALEDEILRMFLSRLQIAISNLRMINGKAQIIIIVDAADNAEMAAKEFGQICFAHEVLREQFPEGCKVVMLCRTERMQLLQPESFVEKHEMLSFAEEETLSFLRKGYPKATEADGLEFHRLTNGNPRVQANALDSKTKCVSDVLKALGPVGTSVERQIENQLDMAIEKIRDSLAREYKEQIDAICCGLAALPPFIPIKVLSAVAKVEESTVKSFVADMGRPIWIADSVIQFRDEPTETWFRQRFAGTMQQFVKYVELLKPLARQFAYVAETLPVLFLQAGLHDELIELALSDDLLPQDNLIDRRTIKVNRLQFAFKAALRTKQYDNAIKIAMLAGEEVAGNKRQLEIFKKNVDLIAPLQDTQKVQELAFKRLLGGEWEGSENIYSASLLSNVRAYHGEAQTYLRASKNWLNIYFEEKRKNDDKFARESLEYEEIAELAFVYHNLNGIKSAVEYIVSWKPPTVIFHVAGIFAKKMIDLKLSDQVVEVAKLGAKNTFFILALCHELLKVGIFLSAEVLERSFETLVKGKTKLPKIEDSNSYNHANILEAVISFVETCALRKMAYEKIIQLISLYFPDKAPVTFTSDYRKDARNIFLRIVALKKTLCPDTDISIDTLLPEKFLDRKKDHEYEQDTREYKEFYGGLLPWYLARSQVLMGNYDDLTAIVRKAQKATSGVLQARYRRYDTMPFEITHVCVDILLFCNRSTKNQIIKLFNDKIKNSEHIGMDTRLYALRGANRLDHLAIIRNELDVYVCDSVKSCTEDTETRAEWYVDLARATIPISIADASEYFNMAIEIVSRFGDEIVDRWQAIASLAHRSCDEEYESAELAYRFIRCAELIGDNVAREKYFNRNDAIRVCTRLSPSSGLAALSRWRDRDVGWFEHQFSAVATEIVNIGFVSPSVGWGLSPFFEESSLPKFVAVCLEKETSSDIRKKILDSAIDYLRLYNTSVSVWQRFIQLKNDLGIESDKLDEINAFYGNDLKEKAVNENRRGEHDLHEIEESELKGIFAGIDLTQSAEIDTAISRFREFPHSSSSRDIFWKYLFTQVPEGDIIKFINAFINSGKMDLYTVETAFPHMPRHWKKKPSVMKKWPDIISQVAKRLSVDLLFSSYRQESIYKALCISSSERYLIYEGIIEGLISQDNPETGDAYFSFVALVANLLNPSHARDLLEFSLARFELHMEDDFSDGNWAKWLQPPDSSHGALAGFIWSALGSPSAEMRWRAAHCVRKLGENRCHNEIDALIEWLRKDCVDAFGSNKFPFYNQHARLYLLIALDRLAKDDSKLLRKHATVFSDYALYDIPHILVRVFASRAALNIEMKFPGSYEKQIVDLLSNTSKSPYLYKEQEGYGKDGLSYWHQKDIVNGDLKFHHGYDFDRYWFEPLGRLFGISAKQVEELATMVVVEEWKISNNGSYLEDPRQHLWNSTYEGKTYHSHGTYPNIDRYSFYLSYHAMCVVASRLLQQMPILFDNRWDEEDPWIEWLGRHTLCSDDGLWLFDRRDAVPLRTPSWMQVNSSEKWIEEITDEYFLESLSLHDEHDDWLNVFGSWEYGQNSYRESVSIASAMVSYETAQALLYALSSCTNPHDFKIPEYNEEGMEFEESPFRLKGWVINNYSENGIDKADKLSGQVYYPTYRIGDSIAEKTNIRADEQHKNWYSGEQGNRCLACQNWSSDITEYSDTEQLLGKRLSASLEMLKRLCIAEDCELIIEVQIRRWVNKSGYSRSGVSDDYVPPKHKIYVFSREGGLRDENGNVEFRQTTCQ